MFPDTDPANRGRDSAEMLQAAWQAVAAAGFRIVNLDCIVFAQQPKLSPYKDSDSPADRRTAGRSSRDMRRREGQDRRGRRPVGREEAIMAECVVLLESTT